MKTFRNLSLLITGAVLASVIGMSVLFADDDPEPKQDAESNPEAELKSEVVPESERGPSVLVEKLPERKKRPRTRPRTSEPQPPANTGSAPSGRTPKPVDRIPVEILQGNIPAGPAPSDGSKKYNIIVEDDSPPPVPSSTTREPSDAGPERLPPIETTAPRPIGLPHHVTPQVKPREAPKQPNPTKPITDMIPSIEAFEESEYDAIAPPIEPTPVTPPPSRPEDSASSPSDHRVSIPEPPSDISPPSRPESLEVAPAPDGSDSMPRRPNQPWSGMPGVIGEPNSKPPSSNRQPPPITREPADDIEVAPQPRAAPLSLPHDYAPSSNGGRQVIQEPGAVRNPAGVDLTPPSPEIRRVVPHAQWQDHVVPPGVSLLPSNKRVDWRPWWMPAVQFSNHLQDPQKVAVTLDQLINLALTNSPAIDVARLDVLIQQEGIREELGQFDWQGFLETLWTDTDEPTGSDLEGGVGNFRLIEEDAIARFGLRRVNTKGGELEVDQSLQIRDSNSQFFNPTDQGLTRLTLRYTQPLLRNSGELVNLGQVYIARHLTAAQRGDTRTQISDLLLNIADVYWNLYRLRGLIAIQEKQYQSAIEVLAQIRKRSRIDAGRQLIVLAQSTVNQRQATLNQTRIELKQAQNELSFLVSVPGWQKNIELMPQDVPCEFEIQFREDQELQTALSNRPEVQAAVGRIKAADVQKRISRNGLLPNLALVLESSVAGVNDQFNVGRSFVDQYGTGAPTYSVGLTLDRPIQNRTAIAQDRRASLEITRATQDLELEADRIRLDVKNTITRLRGNFHQLRLAAKTAQKAAEEIGVINRRRWLFPESDRVSTLYLRELLEAQDRLAAAEQDFLTAQAVYNLAILELRRANGTLFVEAAL